MPKDTYLSDPTPNRLGMDVSRFIDLYALRFEMTPHDAARAILHEDEYEAWARIHQDLVEHNSLGPQSS